MSPNFAVFFLAITIYSASANKILANSDVDGGAAAHFGPFGSQGGAPPSFLVPFFQLFANVSDADRTAFFEIVKNENLTIGQVKNQLQAWADAHGKTEIFANLTATFEAKKADFQAKIQEVIANASLSTAAQAVVTQIQTALNSETLTRQQIGENIKNAFESASNDTKAELRKAFEPFFQAIKNKFGGFGHGFGGHGFGGQGFGGQGFGGQGFGGFRGNHGGQGGVRHGGNNRNNNQNGQGPQNFAVQGGPGSGGFAIFVQPLDGNRNYGGNQALVRPAFVPTNSDSNGNQNSNAVRTAGNRRNNQNTNNNVDTNVEGAGF